MVVVAATTLVGAGAAVGLPQASAATIDTNAAYVLVNRNSGKAVDVYNWATNDGAPIVQYARNDLVVQQWRFVSSGSGWYRLRSVHSGKVLDIAGGSTADGANVVQWTDNNGTNQQFRVVDTTGGYVKLINRNSNKALETWDRSTADGARLSQFTDLSGNNQQWLLARVGTGGGGSTPPPSTPSTPSTPPNTTPNTSFPTPRGTVKVDATQQVSGTFDGGMRRYYGIGDGGQSESQDPMFVLANGATLQNVIIGAPAGDGVHCEGNCRLVNVWWEDVGEDAATFRGGTRYDVIGGGARSASDKVFQHNGGGTVYISGFYVENAGKLYRACGNCSTSSQRHVVLDNIIATGTKSLAGININWGDTARFSRITILNDPSRKTIVCDKYHGVAKGSEPTKVGTGADGRNCFYATSDISYR
ncbi:MAG TPA: pectate lyase [Micromonosporaceae bacterium]|nr:pectate lyase [Micromonosporaceae bacterium]